MGLNGAQIDVLKAVSTEPKVTSNVTRNGSVSGVTAAGLVRRGFVTIKDMKSGERVVKITAAGRKALKGA